MEDNVGTIVIGTKVNNKGLEKGVQKVVNQIKILEKEAEAVEREMENIGSTKFDLQKQFAKGLTGLSKTKEELRQLQTELENWENKVATRNQQLTDSSLDPETRNAIIYTRNLAQEKVQYYKDNIAMAKASMQEETDALNKIGNKIYEQEAKLKKKEIALERINNKLDEQKQKYSEITTKEEKGFNIAGLEKGFKNISNGFSTMLKKVLKIGMALVGVRTIINLITRSFNTLASYNEELGSKVEQMRLVLAVALEPVINWLVNMLQVILSLVNQIMSSLFGINLFGRASELWTEKMKKNMQKSAGSAKEMRKQLAGFDEMNVLNDNVAGAGGGGSGDNQPWNLEEIERPGWMQWILDNGSLLAGIITGIGTALGLIKIGVVDFLQASGIATVIAGIVMFIIDLIQYLKDPAWEKFGDILRDIGVILIGIGILIGNIPVIIIGALILIIGLITKYWEQIKGFINGIGDWFEQKGENFKKGGNKLVADIFAIIGKGIKDLTFIFETFMKTAKGIFDGVITYFKGVFSLDFEKINEGNLQIVKAVWDGIYALIKKTIDRTVENFKLYWDIIKELFTKGATFIATNLLNLYNNIKEKVYNIVVWIEAQFWNMVSTFRNVGIAIGDSFSGAIKGAVNTAFNWIESKVNSFIRMINNLISTINGFNLPGIRLSRLSTISLPRLASGAIINQPGRGVPIGGAIAGEAGREGILPLTDRQAMAELGKEIGKWININATIPVNIGNRQIARVIQEINNDREFAMNS